MSTSSDGGSLPPTDTVRSCRLRAENLANMGDATPVLLIGGKSEDSSCFNAHFGSLDQIFVASPQNRVFLEYHAVSR